MYNFQLDEYVDSLNEDYELIMNEYSGTELFSEVTHALNWLFPDWKMNNLFLQKSLLVKLNISKF